MAKFQCKVCAYVYDEEKEDVEFSKLPDDWVCPVCGVGKDEFNEV
jgi:rubredoxin